VRARAATDPLAGLQARVGHKFKNKLLIEQALRHRSYGADNNERLEFLGDAVLNASIGHLLFAAMPDVPEGELSRVRAQLVRQESLHQIALALDIPSVIRLGEGEARSGGAQRPSILADALEAIIGATYLDAGFDVAHGLVQQLFAEVALAPQTRALAKDAKTELQEWLQGKKLALPAYTVTQVSGKAHQQTFEVECRVPELSTSAKADGRSRRAAEQAAAALVLAQLHQRIA
jgi:ribonuclease III